MHSPKLRVPWRRFRNPFYSIQWQFVIIYFLLAAVVFVVLTFAGSSIISNYLVNQRVQVQLRNTSSLGVQVSSYLAQWDANELYAIGTETYERDGGRVLVLNNSGIVQTDSFSEYNGYVLHYPEIETVLAGDHSTAYGFHRIVQEDGSTFYALYSTSAIIREGDLIGVLLYSTSIQDIVDASYSLEQRMLLIYSIGLVCIVVASIILTRFITRPVKQLTDVALRISAGDLAMRANVRGHNEIAELGQTFNMMCDRLQNMDKQRGEFVSDASHELKTPLASMKILCESLLYQDDVPPEVYKDFLSDINKEIDRLNLLITDLLLLSKMDADDAALNVEKTDLARLVRECVDALRPIATDRGIDVETDVPEDLQAECDPLKLRQALNNLVENAIKYSRENGFVRIEGGRNGTDVYVSVEDNGVGMGAEYLPHIFERFYRVDKARSRETGGTGLGLHIVRRVALMHGGRVDVKSEEGVGSVFTLYLPAVQKDNPGPGQAPKLS